MRLIDADELDNMGYELHRTYREDANTIVYEVKKIGEIPTIEAEPVRHGRWIKTDKHDIYYQPGYKCSVCKILTTCHGRYCPNCGARMEKSSK